MKRFARRTLMVLSFLALTANARAAEVTRVATAFDADNPFDLNIDLGFNRVQKKTTITREHHQATDPNNPTGSLDVVNVRELILEQTLQQMPMRVAFGLQQDLELHFSSSLVFTDDKSWRYAAGSSDANSTIRNNCVSPRGTLVDNTCPDIGTGAAPLFPTPGQSYRAGLKNLTMGFAWLPFNDRRDDTKATWLVGFDYTLPLSPVMDPTSSTSSSKPGEVGDKVHRFSWQMAVSKRLGASDPYFKVFYTLPTQAPEFYSNCDHTDRLAYPENCGTTNWKRAVVGIKPPHVGGFLFGSELHAYDDPLKHQSVAFDLQLGGTYISEGRYYNELSDALGKLLYSEQYMNMGGTFSIVARAAEFAQLRLYAGWYYDTEHYLTNETIGKDVGTPGSSGGSANCSQPNGQVDLSNDCAEISPNFDFRYDLPGRRFRATEAYTFTFGATANITF